jgi:uncharacterized protein (DUF1330 family)
MKTRVSIALALLAGVGIGAATIETLHAQAKAPVYYVAEVDLTNPEAYAKEFTPKAIVITKKYGGRVLALSSNVIQMEGQPPKRVAIQVWESKEKLLAWRDSAEMKDLRKIGEKYAKFRSYALEGAAPQ